MEQPENSDDVIARGERWAPLGAANEAEDNSSFADWNNEDPDYWQRYLIILKHQSFFNKYSQQFHNSFTSYDGEKLRMLEEEQEQLNSSLMALTSHFAQV